jgi:hypothetical protein
MPFGEFGDSREEVPLEKKRSRSTVLKRYFERGWAAGTFAGAFPVRHLNRGRGVKSRQYDELSRACPSMASISSRLTIIGGGGLSLVANKACHTKERGPNPSTFESFTFKQTQACESHDTQKKRKSVTKRTIVRS